MSAKPTPGPWRASCNDLPEDQRPVGESGLRYWDVEPEAGPYRGGVCTVHAAEHIGGITISERDANARLIAAAPDLLEACEKALNYIENTEGELGITLDSGDALRAALAKARGDA